MYDEQDRWPDFGEAVDKERLERLKKQIRAVPGLVVAGNDDELLVLAHAGLGGSY